VQRGLNGFILLLLTGDPLRVQAARMWAERVLQVRGPAALQAALYDLKNRHYRARGAPVILQRVCTALNLDDTGADFQLLPAPEQDVDMDAYVQCLRRYKEGRAPMSLGDIKQMLLL
jgi:hypothetical protein